MARSLRSLCYPCWAGEHEMCRHHPNEDGSVWVTDEDGTRRRVLYKSQYDKTEIPRPPCQCEVDGHTFGVGTCPVTVTDRFSSTRCDKPVKGTMTVRSRFGAKGEVTLEVCGIHRAAEQRKRNNEAKRKEEREEARRKADAQDAATKASEDWAQRIADEFDLPVTGLQGARDGQIRVAMSPERAYAKLSHIRDLLNEVYGDDHPWGNK